MSTALSRRFSPEEYLAFERAADRRHEFHRGDVYQMAGASRWHNVVALNVARLLGNALEERPCEVYANDMRVKVDKTGLYTYPDVAVTCEKPRFEDQDLDTLLNPQVVIEVLSKSTESYDRGVKFGHYRQIDSLREYVLVSQERPLVERFVRQPDGSWNLTEAAGLEARIELTTIGAALPLAKVYAKVEFDTPESTTAAD
ncbi:MAG: Uma2 family endonuclease [Lacipirellulaceae bacterium]